MFVWHGTCIVQIVIVGCAHVMVTAVYVVARSATLRNLVEIMTGSGHNGEFSQTTLNQFLTSLKREPGVDDTAAAAATAKSSGVMKRPSAATGSTTDVKDEAMGDATAATSQPKTRGKASAQKKVAVKQEKSDTAAKPARMKKSNTDKPAKEKHVTFAVPPPAADPQPATDATAPTPTPSTPTRKPKPEDADSSVKVPPHVVRQGVLANPDRRGYKAGAEARRE